MDNKDTNLIIIAFDNIRNHLNNLKWTYKTI